MDTETCINTVFRTNICLILIQMNNESEQWYTCSALNSWPLYDSEQKGDWHAHTSTQIHANLIRIHIKCYVENTDMNMDYVENILTL